MMSFTLWLDKPKAVNSHDLFAQVYRVKENAHLRGDCCFFQYLQGSGGNAKINQFSI